MPRADDEDLFQSSTMTFGEHLEELRGCLIRASIGLAAGVFIGFFVARPVVHLLEHPLREALGEYYSNKALALAKGWQGPPLPYSEGEIVDAVTNRGLTYELREIHPDRLATLLNRDSLPTDDTKGNKDTKDSVTQKESDTFKADSLVPIMLWQPLSRDTRVSITTLSAQEAFGIFIKAALLVGFVLSSPWIFYQLWSFVAAGLYPHEKRLVHVFLPASIGLFLSGVLIAFCFVFRFVLNYLLDFNDKLGLDPDPRISEWMSFVLILPIGFGLGFQLPLVMLFLERIGVFEVADYISQWRLAVVTIFIVSAILTPADPYSMLFLALPLCVLYLGGIGVCQRMGIREPRAVQATNASQ